MITFGPHGELLGYSYGGDPASDYGGSDRGFFVNGVRRSNRIPGFIGFGVVLYDGRVPYGMQLFFGIGAPGGYMHGDPFGLLGRQDLRQMKEVTDCDLFAAEVARIAFENLNSPLLFANALRDRFAPGSERVASTEFASTGFKAHFRDDVGPGNSPNQVRHYVGGFRAALLGGRLGGAYATWRERGGTASNLADLRLNVVSRRHAFEIKNGTASHEDLANMIRRDVCVSPN
jgi:hypothetical protein